jgi:hypothetical protein
MRKLFDGEDAQPDRCQFDRQRDPLQTLAELDHRPFVVRGDLEAGNYRFRPSDEQVDGRELRRLAGSETGVYVGHRQRRHRVHVLAGDHQRLSARGEDVQFRRGPEQPVHQGRGCLEQVLAVVEDQQGVPGAQVVGEDQRGTG